MYHVDNFQDTTSRRIRHESKSEWKDVANLTQRNAPTSVSTSERACIVVDTALVAIRKAEILGRSVFMALKALVEEHSNGLVGVTQSLKLQDHTGRQIECESCTAPASG